MGNNCHMLTNKEYQELLKSIILAWTPDDNLDCRYVLLLENKKEDNFNYFLN